MKQIYVFNDISNSYKTRKNKQFYLFLFFIFITICILSLFYLLHSYYVRIYNAQKTNTLKNKFNISTLYASSNNYTTIKLLDEISIIGLIEIPKINISYPIIENTNKDLLKISVCKFSGPFPNRIGNLCIAGHNYKNNSMFSNLYKLNIGDCFYITDLNNTKLKYIVYKKFVVKENNLDCTKNVDDVEVTLITCYSNDNSKRTVIKAKLEG